MNTQITQFSEGSIYQMSFIGDSDLKPTWKCTKRTPKTVTFERTDSSDKLTRKIKTYDNIEYILQGNYSMAPQISAKRIVTEQN